MFLLTTLLLLFQFWTQEWLLDLTKCPPRVGDLALHNALRATNEPFSWDFIGQNQVLEIRQKISFHLTNIFDFINRTIMSLITLFCYGFSNHVHSQIIEILGHLCLLA